MDENSMYFGFVAVVDSAECLVYQFPANRPEYFLFRPYNINNCFVDKI
jgi:hypothetical protein